MLSVLLILRKLYEFLVFFLCAIYTCFAAIILGIILLASGCPCCDPEPQREVESIPRVARRCRNSIDDFKEIISWTRDSQLRIPPMDHFDGFTYFCTSPSVANIGRDRLWQHWTQIDPMLNPSLFTKDQIVSPLSNECEGMLTSNFINRDEAVVHDKYLARRLMAQDFANFDLISGSLWNDPGFMRYAGAFECRQGPDRLEPVPHVRMHSADDIILAGKVEEFFDNPAIKIALLAWLRKWDLPFRERRYTYRSFQCFNLYYNILSDVNWQHLLFRVDFITNIHYLGRRSGWQDRIHAAITILRLPMQYFRQFLRDLDILIFDEGEHTVTTKFLLTFAKKRIELQRECVASKVFNKCPSYQWSRLASRLVRFAYLFTSCNRPYCDPQDPPNPPISSRDAADGSSVRSAIETQGEEWKSVRSAIETQGQGEDGKLLPLELTPESGIVVLEPLQWRSPGSEGEESLAIGNL